MSIRIHRAGDTYIGTAGPPEVQAPWSTDRPYPRDELRWRIESMGAHPVDVADAFHAADLIRDAVRDAFNEHGVTGQVAVALTHDEAVFVLTTREAARLRGPGLDIELQGLLHKKVGIITEGHTGLEGTQPL